MSSVELYPALAPYLLIGFAFLLPLLRLLRVGRTVSRVVALGAMVFTTLLSIIIYLSTRGGRVLVYTIGGFPIPLGIAYAVDEFSSLLGLLTSLLFPLLAPVSPLFVDDNEYYYSALLGLEAGLLGVFYTGDVFNMFVMLEVFTISAFVLISTAKTRGAFKATITYAIAGMVAGTFFFLSAVLVYYSAGSLNIGNVAAIVSGLYPPMGRSVDVRVALLMPLLIMTWSMLVESAISPLHFWLPGAYSNAPPVVSSILSGLAEGMAFYVVTRLYYTIYAGIPGYIQLMLGFLGGLTVGVAGAGLIASKSLVRVISYTVILDSGMMALALSLGPSGIPVFLSYAVAHALVKPVLFLSSGYARVEGASSSSSPLSVLWSSRALAFSFLIGVLNVVGIPPTALFMAKLQLYMLALESFSQGNPVALITLIVLPLGSILAFIGFVKQLTEIFSAKKPTVIAGPPGYLKALVIALAVTSIVIGLAYNPVQDVINASASAVLDRLAYIRSVLEKTLVPVVVYG
jgi:multicomponent Na+:H+ antiporter subunit D